MSKRNTGDERVCDVKASQEHLYAWALLHARHGRPGSLAGLYRSRNREISPIQGRWVSHDPVGYVEGQCPYEYPITGGGDTVRR
jgi:hypothetical protein